MDIIPFAALSTIISISPNDSISSSRAEALKFTKSRDIPRSDRDLLICFMAGWGMGAVSLSPARSRARGTLTFTLSPAALTAFTYMYLGGFETRAAQPSGPSVSEGVRPPAEWRPLPPPLTSEGVTSAATATLSTR